MTTHPTGPGLSSGFDPFGVAFRHASVGVAICSLDRRSSHVNPALCRILGYSEQELEDSDLIGRLMDGEAAGGTFEKRIVRKNGETAWVEIRSTLVPGATGDLDSLVVVVQDMTSHRVSAEALRESEERYRTLVETAPEMMITVDLEGRFTWFNAAFQNVTGWASVEWIGRRFTELVHPEDLRACLDVFEAAVRGETARAVTHRMLRRDGGWVNAESTGTPQWRDGRVTSVLGIARDVTARVQAEMALGESRRRLQALFDHALHAILFIGEDGRYVDANPAATELLGYGRDELCGMSAADVTPPGERDRLTELSREFQRTGAYTGPYRLRCKDGTVRDTEFRAVADILPGLHLAIVRDVTDRKRVEDELRRRERLFEEAEAAAHIGCWEWDCATDSVIWSAELYSICGVSPDDFSPNPTNGLERVHPEDRALVVAQRAKALEDGGSFSYEARLVRPNGDVRFTHTRGQTVRDERGRVVRMTGVTQDVTESKQQEFIRRELMSRILSAHEEEQTRISRELHDGPGQSLAAVLLGLRDLESAASLVKVKHDAARLRELVAQIIDEVGRLARGLRPLALDDLGLRAALERCTKNDLRFPFRVVLEIENVERLPRDVESALYRAVQEALSNAARHARPTEVRIRLRRVTRAVHLTVSDDGCGFDVAAALGPGRGLGLHGLRERATLLGGRAEFHSVPGQGATVLLTLPLTE